MFRGLSKNKANPSDQVTPKIDVWALGVLLFQIVFKGALPFAEVRPHGRLARLFFNNFVVEIEWCPGCCIHTSPQGAWRPAGQDLCLREPQPSCTTPQHGGLGPSITWHDQVLNTNCRFNLQHLTCLGLYSYRRLMNLMNQRQCLEKDPQKRASVGQLLVHPYLRQVIANKIIFSMRAP